MVSAEKSYSLAGGWNLDASLGELRVQQLQTGLTTLFGFNVLVTFDNVHYKTSGASAPVPTSTQERLVGLTCEECGKWCKSKAGLVAHHRVHDNDSVDWSSIFLVDRLSASKPGYGKLNWQAQQDESSSGGPDQTIGQIAAYSSEADDYSVWFKQTVDRAVSLLESHADSSLASVDLLAFARCGLPLDAEQYWKQFAFLHRDGCLEATSLLHALLRHSSATASNLSLAFVEIVQSNSCSRYVYREMITDDRTQLESTCTTVENGGISEPDSVPIKEISTHLSRRQIASLKKGRSQLHAKSEETMLRAFRILITKQPAGESIVKATGAYVSLHSQKIVHIKYTETLNPHNHEDTKIKQRCENFILQYKNWPPHFHRGRSRIVSGQLTCGAYAPREVKVKRQIVDPWGSAVAGFDGISVLICVYENCITTQPNNTLLAQLLPPILHNEPLYWIHFGHLPERAKQFAHRSKLFAFHKIIHDRAATNPNKSVFREFRRYWAQGEQKVDKTKITASTSKPETVWQNRSWAVEESSLIDDHVGSSGSIDGRWFVQSNCDQMPFTLTSDDHGRVNWLLRARDFHRVERTVSIVNFLRVSRSKTNQSPSSLG
ncbi:hypothetical protein CLF_102308 [Clonorchis sinensis]|uniref:C2H2-type domain-containing protein n=1 Tax=Clonorchis sinensis TaxID=79923 RepID=G7YN07_CLOSI|nr:hypothetical protein CLF_102308 [Clonorchis sinensis]